MASESAPSPTQSAAPGCTGAATIYNTSGLVVPFRNLCGKDISAPADFPDPFVEESFASCLARCVQTKPLCYGFDFRPLYSGEYNCWLKNAEFDERTAVSRDFVADAAMLSPDLLGNMADECKELGLLGCFEKYGGWRKDQVPSSSSVASSASSGVSSASSAVSSMTSSTAATSNTADESKSGLSTGASAGIGVGVGVVVLGALLFGVVFLLRRKQRARSANASYGAVEVGSGENPTGYGHGREKSAAPTELYAQHNYQQAAELDGAGPPAPPAQPVESGVNK